MAKHSISEAARISGKSRSTIYRHIKQGKVSKEIGSDGEPMIDTSELRRVYGDQLRSPASPGQSEIQVETPTDPIMRMELDALRRENASLREERDKWAAQAERLTLLLVDHRPTQSDERSEPGLLARLFGR